MEIEQYMPGEAEINFRVTKFPIVSYVIKFTQTDKEPYKMLADKKILNFSSKCQDFTLKLHFPKGPV